MDAAKLACLKPNDSTPKKEALDWYHTSFATADTWACSIRLVGTKYDENGFAVDVFCEELTGI